MLKIVTRMLTSMKDDGTSIAEYIQRKKIAAGAAIF